METHHTSKEKKNLGFEQHYLVVEHLLEPFDTK